MNINNFTPTFIDLNYKSEVFCVSFYYTDSVAVGKNRYYEREKEIEQSRHLFISIAVFQLLGQCVEAFICVDICRDLE